MLSPGDSTLEAMFEDRGTLTAEATAYPGGAPFDLAEIAPRFVVTRELAGDLPDTVSLVGGAVSASVKIDVDGAMSGAPHPLRKVDREAWIGARVDLAAGYDETTVPMFSGRLREFGFDESSYGLTMDLLDNSDRMRAPVTLPMFGSRSFRAEPQNVLRAPTNLSAVIVAALHANGIRVTPAPRAGAVISIPLTFGMLADIGWTVPGSNIPRGATWLTQGKFGHIPSSTAAGLMAYPSRSALWQSGATVQFEFWFNHQPPLGFASTVMVETLTGHFLRFVIEPSGDYWIQSAAGSGGTRLNTHGDRLTAGWHHLAFEVSYAGDYKLWRGGALIQSGSGVFATAARPNDGGIRLRHTSGFGRVQGVIVHHAVSGPLSAPDPAVGTFQSQADIDLASLEVDTLPPIDGRVGWELCKEIANAELGMVGFSETGRFYFKNRATLNGATAPVLTFGTDMVENLTGSATIDSVRTRVTSAAASSWLTWAGRGAETEASTAIPSFLAGEALTIPTGSSSHLLFSERAFIAEQTDVEIINAIGRAWDTAVGMALCTDSAGMSRYTGTAVKATIHPVGPATWRLDVVNSSGVELYTVWPLEWGPPTYLDTPFGLSDGDPAIWVNGWGLGSDESFPRKPVNVTNAAALAKWGDRTFELPQSPWRQDPVTIEALATSLLADLSEPRAHLGDVNVPADLRLQIGDPVLITDWQGRLPDVLARVTRTVTTIDLEAENGMTASLDLRTLPDAP